MSARPEIAIVGLACRYGDAASPAALWETALASRRAFRRIPPERLSLEDYGSVDRDAPDRTYATCAAVLEGYEFDRRRYRVSAEAYRAADPAHWLALDVASDALRDAGFEDGRDLPHETTGVLIGNTLTGEFSRAASLRLRWPYVRRVLDTVLEEAGESPAQRAALLPRLEAAFKAPFAAVGAETLAGGLSNTIAGRICNHFDLKGGGYTVDGACASSLLALAHACSALAAGDLDAALAGGVDVSLDPFELVGFAKAGALAADAMRVYDAEPTGFWPGEGCGVAVLMRRDDAIARGCRIYAVVRGWGVSSDGNGGLTRPEVDGQILAIERAYTRAEYGIETVGYIEGHGTGTAVGDATELRALTAARRRSSRVGPRLAIGSIKANIGHTKAAAGIAGLLKATYAVHTEMLPPTSGCRTPHALLAAPDSPLGTLDEPTPWPAGAPLRAGVSSMGFGGINVHVTLEGPATSSRRGLTSRERACARNAEADVELVLLSGRDERAIAARLDELLDLAPRLSLAELSDLAVHLQRNDRGGPIRVAVLADSPLTLSSRLRRARDVVAPERLVLDADAGVFAGGRSARPRLGFLFSGQGAPVRTTGGAWSRRFDVFRSFLSDAALPRAAEVGDTAVAQPTIVSVSLAATRVLESLGLRADVAIGHSLGELTALAWAQAITEEVAIELARARGDAMARLAIQPGAMLALRASAEAVTPLLTHTAAVIAALNAPDQTVVSGARPVVEALAPRARRNGIDASMLPVAHGFHSPLMAPVVDSWRRVLTSTPMRRLQRSVVSTIVGRELREVDDLQVLLEQQLVMPVRFLDAMRAAGEVDLWIEVGPGRAVANLAAACGAAQALPVDAGAGSLRDLLAAVAAAYVCGVDVNTAALADGRFVRSIDPSRRRVFLANPCELAVSPTLPTPETAVASAPAATSAPSPPPAASTDESTCDLLVRLIAARTELPLASVRPENRFLSELHLNSIAVSELLQEAARRMGMIPLSSPTDYADASVDAAARALDALKQSGSTAAAAASPCGLSTWVRAFDLQWRKASQMPASSATSRGTWQVVAPDGHPLSARIARLCADGEGGPGTIVCLDSDASRSLTLLLEAAQAALRNSRGTRFVIVQEEEVAEGFARTLSAEAGSIDVVVVTLPFRAAGAAERVWNEARIARGFHSVRYDEQGSRLAPVLEVVPLPAAGAVPLSAGDVLLVTGGGKGIGAECALALARRTNARLIVMGRTPPMADAALAANLSRMRAAGVQIDYVSADLGDAAAVRRAVASIRQRVGDITAVLHAAGTNDPALISALDSRMLEQAARAKVNGLQHVLDAIDPTRLRLLVSFGSVIARVGLPGEAHYACANARLRLLTERAAAAFPRCRAMTIEWSVWAGVGMGERLGRVDALQHRGITPIDVDTGIDLLQRLLDPSVKARSVTVAGRLGDAPPIPLAGGTLPFRRFLETPRVHYPGIELVADAELSRDADPYLEDHQLGGELLFPAVMGLEAMAQAAMALTGAVAPPDFENVEFSRPIVVPHDGTTVLRTVALVAASGEVRVALRSSASAFQVEHFTAVCRWRQTPSHVAPVVDVATRTPGAIHPARHLYGPLLFQSGPFARVRGYRHLLATACHAEIEGGDHVWFARYLPDTLVLGDPGARDAVLHSVQACIPQMRIVPVAVERLRILQPLAGPCAVHAQQRRQDGAEFTWDLEVRNAAHEPIEVWEGVRLRAIEQLDVGAADVLVLGAYVERRLPELGHDAATRVVVLPHSSSVRDGTAAVTCLLGAGADVRRRPDGRPEVAEAAVSVSHATTVTMAVASDVPVGCDIEPVNSRSAEVWRDLLGRDGAALGALIAEERREPPAASATRVWTARECLKKAGAPPGAPLLFDRAYPDGWVTLRANGYRISTWIGVRPGDDALALAIGTGAGHARIRA